MGLGFVVFASIMGIYFEAWKKCDQVWRFEWSAFYAVFLADGITPAASEWDVAFAAPASLWVGAWYRHCLLAKKARGQ